MTTTKDDMRLTDDELERRTGEPHIDGWPLLSGLPPPKAGAVGSPVERGVGRLPEASTKVTFPGPPKPMTLPWVVVSPSGVVYVGLHEDEAGAWCICLGWPSDEEIAERKRAGWYAAQATMTWMRPNV